MVYLITIANCIIDTKLVLKCIDISLKVYKSLFMPIQYRRHELHEKKKKKKKKNELEVYFQPHVELLLYFLYNSELGLSYK